jgi:hypothetical protein
VEDPGFSVLIEASLAPLEVTIAPQFSSSGYSSSPVREAQTEDTVSKKASDRISAFINNSFFFCLF